MDEMMELWQKPVAEEIYLVAGWRQWADAGAISSLLPQYLIERTQAKKIGRLKVEDCYLFQIPGAHHFLRPKIKLDSGYRLELEVKRNEFFYAGDEKKGLVIFLGDEPHMKAGEYARAFFQVVQALSVKRVVAVGGVYGAMPYDKDREVSCIYSLREMKEELDEYVVRFSNYEGGATIGSYLVDQAEPLGIEFMVFYAFVPAYDFAQPSIFPQGVRIENDFKAWHDLMVRINHMFALNIDLSELARQSDELNVAMDAKIEELEGELPQLKVRQYLEKLDDEFTERSFVPLGNVWHEGLQDLFDDLDD